MSLFIRRSTRRLLSSPPAPSRSPPCRAYSARHGGHHRAHSRAPPPPPPVVTIVDSCPAPTCGCRPAPEGLVIDREHPLNGTMAAYSEQVLISTGKDDWKSRIDEEEDATFQREMKALLGRGGKYADPYHNVAVTNSSLRPATSASPAEAVSAYLLPSFRYVPHIPTSREAVEAFVKGFILPERAHHSHDVLPSEQREALERDAAFQQQFSGVRDVTEILVLICGHGGRDQRCGIYGPLLRAEFEEKLQMVGIPVSREAEVPDEATSSGLPPAKVGVISHIGGHKYAGNVIIYVPPSFTQSPLAGTGVWYGRVDPEHVEGIVKTTILGGKIIKSLFRGAIDRDRDILRL